MKNLSELKVENIKAITFDLDGVIIPTGTELRESPDGTELFIKTKIISDDFFRDIEILKKHIWINFSSGRNLLYLQSVLSPILWKNVSLQGENGNVTLLEGKLSAVEYDLEYFDLLKEIKEEIKKEEIRGFEPKNFILTVHCDKGDKIPEIVRSLDKKGLLYCLWTGEAYDIGHKSRSKAEGVSKICEFLKIGAKQMLTMGNNLNDVEMLKYGTGVTVNPARAEGEYKTSGVGLGGEEIARYLVDYYQNK
ncbi:MAG: HAD hydrolase family protein [Candidatus Pacebacteria bacterium]|nr:HAD hydrolase family protein [Candidatus Paceibacterota bacterium]